jgi:hypothetical protein
MREARRSPLEIVREMRLPRDERRAAKAEREVEERMRSERDSERHAERLAARNAAEAQRHRNQFGL